MHVNDGTLNVGSGLEESTFTLDFISPGKSMIFSSAYYGDTICKPGTIEDKDKNYGVTIIDTGKPIGY